MSVSYFVRYEGTAENPEGFIARYRSHHVPILSRLPGIRTIVLHTPIASDDPFPTRADPFLLLVQMVFDTQADLSMALRAEARAEARADSAAFPPFHGVIYHQPALAEEVFAE